METGVVFGLKGVKPTVFKEGNKDEVCVELLTVSKLKKKNIAIQTIFFW
jgi:hypothetical protein